MKIFEALWRGRVERDSEMVVRHVKVDRNRTRRSMIRALRTRGREEYVDGDVLETMPTQGMEEVDVYFFLGKKTMLVAELDREFESRLLVPDPFAQMQANIDDPAFSDEHPNGVQWQDADGNYCYFVISRWRGGRGVTVNRDDQRWLGNAWFAGVLR